MCKRFFGGLVIAACLSAYAVSEPCTTQVFFGSADTAEILRSVLLQHIESARETLDIAVSSFTSSQLADAVEEAQKRGVSVRILLPSAEEDRPDSQFESLAAAQASVRFVNTSGVFSHRFAVIDRQVVLTGSSEWIDSVAPHAVDSLVRIRCELRTPGAPVQAFLTEFERLWANSRNASPDVRPDPWKLSSIRILAIDAAVQCIDLWNSSDRTLSLSDWSLSDLEGTYTFPAGTTILPSDALRICIDTFNPEHNSDGVYLDPLHDELFLLSPTGEILDEFVW